MQFCQALLVADVILKLIPEMFQRRAGRVDQRRAHRAKGAAIDAGGQFQRAVEVIQTALAVFEAVKDLVQPHRTNPAGRAAPAGFVGKELGQAPSGFHHAGGFIHDDDRPGAEFAPGLFQRLEAVIGPRDGAVFLLLVFHQFQEHALVRAALFLPEIPAPAGARARREAISTPQLHKYYKQLGA